MPPRREIARNYSEALLNAAIAAGSADDAAADAEVLLSFESQGDVYKKAVQFLRSSRVLPGAKQELAAGLAEQLALSRLTARWLHLMARNGRFNLLKDICTDFMNIYRCRTGNFAALVETAFPLSAAEKESIAAALAERLGASVAVDEKINETLVAGIRASVAGMVWDASVLGGLNRISTSLA